MKIALIDNGTSLLEKLKKLIPGEEIVFQEDCKNLDQELFDVIILSGTSKQPFYGNEEIFEKELELIKNRKKLLIGICLGCELIAHAFDMKLEEMKEQKRGLSVYKVKSNKDLFDNKDTFEAYENHIWKIDHVNDLFETLAESEHGPAIIKHKELPMYGIQFHPENLTEESFGDEIFNKIIKQEIENKEK